MEGITMIGNIFALRGNDPHHILLLTQSVDDFRPTVPEIGMVLNLEKTSYGSKTALAQITQGKNPNLKLFTVCCVSQQQKIFTTPAIMFEPGKWPIDENDLKRHLKQIFHNYEVKFKIDGRLPIKKFASITITEVKPHRKG